MADLDIKDFESQIIVRELRDSDAPEVVELGRKCYPGQEPWTEKHVRSWVANYPKGQIGIEYDGKIVACCASVLLQYEENLPWYDWRKVSDNGFIRNHNPKGDTLYGIEIMVDPEFRGLKLARRLYNERKRIAREANAKQIIVGGRIPGYHEHAKEMSARDYVEKVMDRSLHDPVLTTQVGNGFVLQRLIPDYLPTDWESCGYATFLKWTNLDWVEDPSRMQQTVAPVRICAVQFQMRWIDTFEEFAQQCEFFVDVGSDYKSDFVLFPELFTNQLMAICETKDPAQAVREVAKFTPEYLDLMSHLAIKYAVNIVGGSHLTVENEKLYNIAYLFHRDGRIDKQYKIHITPSEKRWWGVNPGDEVEVFDTDRGPISILICYDIEFPELARIATGKGANIIFVPFNTDTREGYLRVRYCAQARCVENEIYVSIAGCTGNLPHVANVDIHYAQSAIFTPSDISFNRDGIAAECTPNIETVVIGDVDTAASRRHRGQGTVRNWLDRRTDLYRVVYSEDDGDHEV